MLLSYRKDTVWKLLHHTSPCDTIYTADDLQFYSCLTLFMSEELHKILYEIHKRETAWMLQQSVFSPIF